MLQTVVPEVSVLAASRLTTPSLSIELANSKQLEAFDETKALQFEAVVVPLVARYTSEVDDVPVVEL